MINLKDPYGFIYITTNLINGKRYIGKKVFDKKGVWKSYVGSGVALKSAINKYGRENFVRSIICWAYTNEELCMYEKECISFLGAVNSKDFYNIADGGDGYNFFGSDLWDNSKPVYCINLKKAFKNAAIAGQILGENESTIRTKCKYFLEDHNIKKGYAWCYVVDMYKTAEVKACYASIPVVDLSDGKVYCSWNNAKKMTGKDISRRSVITYERYKKYLNNGKDIVNKFLRLDDYFKDHDYTN